MTRTFSLLHNHAEVLLQRFPPSTRTSIKENIDKQISDEFFSCEPQPSHEVLRDRTRTYLMELDVEKKSKIIQIVTKNYVATKVWK